MSIRRGLGRSCVMESGKPGLVSGQHSKEKTDRCLWHHSPPREAWLLLILKPEPYWFGGRGVEDSRVWPSQSNCQATVVSLPMFQSSTRERHHLQRMVPTDTKVFCMARGFVGTCRVSSCHNYQRTLIDTPSLSRRLSEPLSSYSSSVRLLSF